MPSVFSLAAADAERITKSRPHTPPFTPTRSKVRAQRADSPAPSIHPTETVSPVKAVVAQNEVPNGVTVQELYEGHPDYSTDVELVYPDELEEVDNAPNVSDLSDSDDDSEDNIASRLSQLQCEDKAGENNMRQARRERRLSKRSAMRIFKRSHSQSINSESEVTDADALDDHDLPNTARRLRRRTQGPDSADFRLNIGSRGPSGPPQSPSPSPVPRGKRAAPRQRLQRNASIAVGDSSSEGPMDTSD